MGKMTVTICDKCEKRDDSKTNIPSIISTIKFEFDGNKSSVDLCQEYAEKARKQYRAFERGLVKDYTV